jgi:hypothetical protein
VVHYERRKKPLGIATGSGLGTGKGVVGGGGFGYSKGSGSGNLEGIYALETGLSSNSWNRKSCSVQKNDHHTSFTLLLGSCLASASSLPACKLLPSQLKLLVVNTQHQLGLHH